jgi:Autotransporter beta-domain
MRREWAFILGCSVAVVTVLHVRGVCAQTGEGTGAPPNPPQNAPVANEPLPPETYAPPPAASAPAAPPPATVWEPPPPPAQDPSARTHDGFFLRMDLGFGKGFYTQKSSGQDLWTASGVDVAFALRLGGTVFPGFVLGGGIVSNSIVSPTIKDNGETITTDSDTSIGLGELQLFAAYYPDPHGGFHLLGSVGFGAASVSQNNRSESLDVAGLVLGGGIGYDFWVSSQWSLGPTFELTYASLNGSGDNSELSATYVAPVLSFTATYH